MGGFPLLDFSSFESSDAEASRRAATDLAALCHEYGFVAVSGHGLSDRTLSKAFQVSREFFALPNEEKMKAPHPPTPKPHRGFSGIGVEKVYQERAVDEGDATGVRQIKDYKESYEIGSETNKIEPNIWIPDETLPIFRPFMLNFYAELDQLAARFMRAFMIGLNLDMGSDQEAFLQLNSHDQNQLRLLYYPAVGHDELGKTVLSRLPTHTDFSGFTMTFQDSSGLEFQNPTTGLFSPAVETKNILLLNVGTILQRLTNDYFIAAEHRVTVPSHGQGLENGMQARYSIPYFVNPRHDYRIETLDRFVSPSKPAKYESVRYDEYSARITKFQYVPPGE